MRAATFLVLLAAAAAAQVSSQGVGLRRTDLDTTAPVNLFVNGELGRDANRCVDGGPFACATLEGALRKLPPNLWHPVTVTLEARSDGGVLDYRGAVFNFQTWRNDAGSGSLTVRGTLGPATVDSGVLSGAFTFDAGGALDGGRPDLLDFSSFRVADAGWTPGNLRGRFARLLRADGGLVTTYVVFDNTPDSFTVAQQVSGATAALGASIDLVEPKTRVTQNAYSGAHLFLFNHPQGSSLSIQRLDIVPPLNSAITSWARAGATTFANVRMFYGNGTDSIAPSDFASLSISNSFLTPAGGRYLVGSTGDNGSLSLFANVVSGTTPGSLFMRVSGARLAVTSNTFFSLNTPFLQTTGYDCAARGASFSGNRFLAMSSYGIMMGCIDGWGSVQHHANAYRDIALDAVYFYGNMYAWTNVSSGIVVHNTSQNVAGYGMRCEKGARCNSHNGSGWGDSPRGALGDVLLDGTAINTAAALDVLPAGFQCVVSTGAGAPWGSRLCKDGQ